MVGQFFITRVLGKSEPKARTGSEIVEITYLNQFGVEETVVGYLDGKMDKVSLDSPNGIRLFGSRDEMRFQDPFVVYKPTRISEL